MKIVILGAGALGSLIAAHLARVGEKVTLIARGERTKILQEKGITVTGLADFTVPVTVIDKPHEAKEADVLVIAVKTYDNDGGPRGYRY
jgi:2-dehydropantoate 2-reductase